MKVVSMLACRELLHPTFGKRAAPTQEPSMTKRRAAEAPSWKPEDHDVYLRKLLGAKPEMTLPDLSEAIARDHDVVIERNGMGYFRLQKWLQTMRSTNQSRRQLTDYYTEWVQEQRRAQPHLSGTDLFKRLSCTGLNIDRLTFKSWWDHLPPPPEPMNESSATVDDAPQPMDEARGSDETETPISEAAFSEYNEVVWACFTKNPHLGAAAMATKLRPAIGVVSTQVMGQWLAKAQKEPLDLERLRCYRESIEEFMSSHPDWTQPKVLRFLAEDYNVQVPHQTLWRLVQEIEAPEGMSTLTGKQLPDYGDYLLQLLEETPTMGPVQLLRNMQKDKHVTTTIHIMRRWRTDNLPASGCRRVPCAHIASEYWTSILSLSPAISHGEVKERLAKDLKVWCYDCNLKQFCTNWKRDSKARVSVQRHWQTALDKQFHVTSVLSNPKRVPVTAPSQVFRYWTYLVSWAVCQNCGRKKAASWRTPTRSNGTWQLIYPDISNGCTCAHHAFWQQSCPKQPYEIEDSLMPLRRFKGKEVYVSPERRHWPVYNPATGDNGEYVNHGHYKNVDSTVEETRESLLNLSKEEAWALAPIRIFIDMKPERGKKTQARTYTMKKWGISRAEWVPHKISDNLLSRKVKAAYKWLLENNATYKEWIEEHDIALNSISQMDKPKYWIRTSTLLLHMDGVEVAAFPLLYPRPSFGDTDLRKRKCLEESAENSIVTSHMRKLISSCTGYMLRPELTFLIHDIAMARRLTKAIKVSEQRNFSAEIATDHYTDSEAYWRHEQDISCDMVRQMARWSEVPSTDPMGNKIYEFCNDPLGKKCMAFPNFFITIAPAEWLFPLPSWLQQMVANDRLSNVSGMVALLGT